MVGTVCDTCTSNGYHCPILEFFCSFFRVFFLRWCRLHKNVSAVGLKSLKILNFGHSSLEVSNIGRESRHIGTTLERAITYIPLDNNFTQINCRYEYLNLNYFTSYIYNAKSNILCLEGDPKEQYCSSSTISWRVKRRQPASTQQILFCGRKQEFAKIVFPNSFPNLIQIQLHPKRPGNFSIFQRGYSVIFQ